MIDRRALTYAAIKEAEGLRKKANVSPISRVDPFDLASEICNCRVFFKALPSLEGMYSHEPTPTIIIGSERPSGRQAFTCAHELAHHIFGHGIRIDQLNQKENVDKEEILADYFAAFLLMPQLAVSRALNDRSLALKKITPIHIYKLSNYFGVGYSTLLTHLTYALRLMPEDLMKILMKTKPKKIKSSFGVDTNSSLYFIDYLWHPPAAISMATGDILATPQSCIIEDSKMLSRMTSINNTSFYKALHPGITRAYNEKYDWYFNVRIARENYEGLAEYRFLEEGDE